LPGSGGKNATAFGEYGYAVDQSGDRWATAVKGDNRAVTVCGLGQGRSTQLTVFVAGSAEPRYSPFMPFGELAARLLDIGRFFHSF
jgi:hypothetical protein